MSVLADGKAAHVEPNEALVRKKTSLFSWLFSYEIYVIVIVATFLRLYSLNTTEFDADQADIFRMAHDAVSHGHLVATSNVASIGVYNPPGIIYTLMIPAAFTANPIGGAIETALLAVFGIFFTYWFTRRYYGRVAATIGSSLFAVTSVPLFYSRFMWNQNLLLFFVPLFMIVLFRGVVDRRPGWLFPALFLYGLLFQWHGSSLLLVAPLVVAFLLAPNTVRWRDIVLGVLSLIVLYAPYIVWLVATNFAVLALLSQAGSFPSVIDNQSWLFYLHFLNPYDKPFTNSSALLYGWQKYFNWIHPAMKVLIIMATLFALGLALFLRTKKTESEASRMLVSWWRKVWYWVKDLQESPSRCGLLVLLVWQAFPLLVLVKHSLFLFPHYFIILMPGPFILIGILLAKSAEWFRTHGRRYRFVSVGIYAFSCILLLFQAVASTASVLDSVQGHFVDKNLSYPYYSDLNSLQLAVAKADQIAQQNHLSRVIVVADVSTRSAFRYLSEQLHTPATVIDDSCLLLPGPSAGPFVMLVPPYETKLDGVFSSGYIHVNKSSTSARLGGDPFRLYVVDPLPQASAQGTLSSNIQFVSAQTQSLQKKSWAVTRWNLLQSAPASSRSTYSYRFTDMDTVKRTTPTQQVCTTTRVQAGDQLIAFLPYTSNQTALHIQVEHSSTTPYTITMRLFGVLPLAFDTFQQDSTRWTVLKTDAGASTVTVPLISS